MEAELEEARTEFAWKTFRLAELQKIKIQAALR